MKKLFLVALSVFAVTLTDSFAVGSSLKLEGTCSGHLADGTEVNFNYYSDFNGCNKVSKSAIAFNSGIEGLITGSRAFKNNKDYYNFPKNDLTFADSTGNTSGKLGYRDSKNVRRTINVQCDIRDYEYSDC
jgi:hypothetical protein